MNYEEIVGRYLVFQVMDMDFISMEQNSVDVIDGGDLGHVVLDYDSLTYRGDVLRFSSIERCENGGLYLLMDNHEIWERALVSAAPRGYSLMLYAADAERQLSAIFGTDEMLRVAIENIKRERGEQ